jgi:hypothetical protein
MTGFVPFDRTGDNARLLLSVADMLGIDQQKVATSSEGFVVPDEILDGFLAAKQAQRPPQKPARRQQATRPKEVHDG